jgi:bifunctional DNA primase/polymerase-like protein
MNTLEYALDYASQGWAVLPLYGVENGQCMCGRLDCGSPGKHPMISGGSKAASIDQHMIKEWWRDQPNANIGIATGSASGLIVVDVDVGHGREGFESLAALEELHGEFPKSACVRTGSGGLHIYLAAPQSEVRNSAGKLGAVDVQDSQII